MVKRHIKIFSVSVLGCVVAITAFILIRVSIYHDKFEILPISKWSIGTSPLVINYDYTDGHGETIVYGHSVIIGPFRLSSFTDYGIKYMHRLVPN